MLTLKQKDQINEALSRYLLENNVKYSNVAKGAQVTASYFTALGKGHYFTPHKDGETAIPDNVFRKIASFINYSINEPTWQRVTTAETTFIEDKLHETKELGSFSAIIGSTGCGKTYTVDHFVSNNRHADVFRITVGCLHKVGDVIDDLMQAMNIELQTKSLVKKLRLITNKIKDIYLNGGSPLIIIDEAENLKLPVFGLIKQLYDNLIMNAKRDKMCGIVLIGTEQLVEKIEKLSKRDKAGMPQFTRRIKAGVKKIEHRDWYEDKPFLDYLTKKVGDKDIVALLKVMASNYGEVSDYIEPAMIKASSDGEPFTLNFFKTEYSIGC